jgi:hypothetical protein
LIALRPNQQQHTIITLRETSAALAQQLIIFKLACQSKRLVE